MAISSGVYYATGDSEKTPKFMGEEKMRSGLEMLSPELAKGFGEKEKNVLYTYEIENRNGELARFGVSRFRDGWNLSSPLTDRQR